MAFYDSFIRLFNGFFRGIYRVQIIGLENVPSDTNGLLICANHTTAADPFIIGACLKFKIFYLAKQELFHIPIVGQAVRAFGAVPVNRGSGDVGAVRAFISLHNENKTIGIFPQGHRYPGKDPRKTEVHAGIGMVLYRTQATVLPICVQGKDNRVRLFHKTAVIIGKPIPYTQLVLPENTAVHSDIYRALTDQVFDAICTMGEEHPIQ